LIGLSGKSAPSKQRLLESSLRVLSTWNYPKIVKKALMIGQFKHVQSSLKDHKNKAMMMIPNWMKKFESKKKIYQSLIR
jgi:hypothetical protein